MEQTRLYLLRDVLDVEGVAFQAVVHLCAHLNPHQLVFYVFYGRVTLLSQLNVRKFLYLRVGSLLRAQNFVVEILRWIIPLDLVLDELLGRNEAIRDQDFLNYLSCLHVDLARNQVTVNHTKLLLFHVKEFIILGVDLGFEGALELDWFNAERLGHRVC